MRATRRTRLGLTGVALAAASGLCAGCFGGDPPPERGFALSWRLVDAAAPDPGTATAMSCAQAGVATVLVDALATDGQRFRTEFTCDTLEGVTPALPQSSYQVFLTARAADKTPRSQIKFNADNFEEAGADLGLTIFQIDLTK